MSIQNLMKLIDDVYQFRHSENLQEGGNAENKPFFISIGEYLIYKYKQKKMLDQQAIDFLASLDYFRHQIPEVSLFYEFFVEQTYDSSDLTFYLFVRSHAEREIGIDLSRMTSGDSRQVRIYQSKGLKLIAFIYE